MLASSAFPVAIGPGLKQSEQLQVGDVLDDERRRNGRDVFVRADFSLPASRNGTGRSARWIRGSAFRGAGSCAAAASSPSPLAKLRQSQPGLTDRRGNRLAPTGVGELLVRRVQTAMRRASRSSRGSIDIRPLVLHWRVASHRVPSPPGRSHRSPYAARQ
jgi:hypothetical protein